MKVVKNINTKYLGKNKTPFVLTFDEPSVQVDDIIYPEENKRVLTKVLNIDNKTITLQLMAEGTYLPNYHTKVDTIWCQVDP
jgi:flagellar hook assembly protein FlgD